MLKRYDIILAIISGLLLIPGFPPFDLYPVAWIAIVPLLFSLRGKNVRTSFLLGTLTGFVFFLGTIYWVFNSIYYYGNIPAAAGLLLMLALCLYLGLYLGVFSAVFSSLSKKSGFPAVITVPVLWVTLEFLRTYALTGFPWSILGYSQYRFLSLIQVSDITGVYGISFIVASFNGLVHEVLSLPGRSRTTPLFSRWTIPLNILIFVVMISIVLTYGLWKINTADSGKEIRVSVIQGNIEQGKKWDKNFQREVIDTYKDLSVSALADVPEIIVWPESALPFVFGYDEEYTREFSEFQKGLGTNLLFGSVTAKEIETEKPLFSNSAVLMSPEGKVLSIYNKMHLVPYGEYVPLRRILPFIKKLTAGIGDFVRGREPVIMETPSFKIGSLICYEIIFPGLVRKFTDKGANILVTITNDAWFGRTSAPYQHFSMAVFRAIENRVPVIRAANTGISGFIDSKGRIQRSSDIFVKEVLTEDVTIGGPSKSFYSRYGDVFTFLCIIGAVLLIANNFTYGKK